MGDLTSMFDVDWGHLFVPTTSLAEIFLRGTVIYLLLFAVIRLLPRREVGGLGAADILVIVLIADAVQEGMSGRYESITEGLLLAGTIFFWATAIDWLDFRFPQLRLSEGGPIQVVKDGRLLERQMRRQKVTEEEVMSHLRQHGYDDLADVSAAFIEGDGQFSVLGRRRSPSGGPRQKPRAATGR
jgi:uncharacterized membrane protein YcaP (DUF421 family)